MAPKRKSQKTSPSNDNSNQNINNKKENKPKGKLTAARADREDQAIQQKKQRIEDDALKPKEKTELELETLIFGDNEEFIGEAFSRVGHELSSDEEEDGMFGEEDDENDEHPDGPGHGSTGDMFFIDTGPVPEGGAPVENEEDNEKEDDDDDEEEGFHSTKKNLKKDAKLIEIYGARPAWVDEDDETLVISLKSANRLKKLRKVEEEDTINGVDYEQRLRRQFEKIYPVPNWAQPDDSRKRRRGNALGGIDSDSDYSDEEEQQEDNTPSIVMSSKGMIERSRLRMLSSESISMTRVKNANQQGYSKAVVQAVEFHPNSQMLLTAGFDRTLRLFQIDGKLNPMMQSIFFKDLPINKAAFSVSGNSIITAGRRPYYYVYDIEDGKVDRSKGVHNRKEKSLEKFSLSPCGRWIAFLGRDGYIMIVNSSTRLWIKNLKMNGNVRAVAWSSDSQYLYSVGGDAEVYQWDVDTGKCLHRFADDGGFKPISIAVSPNDQFFAVGSRSGIVNIYDRSCLTTRAPKPLRALGNLTTAIHILRFNHDSQILAMASHARKDQLRLVHLPSLKVFPNWPTRATPLSYITCLSFSPNSGYLAIGNDKGKALLYRVNHYTSA
ncbi:U3 snoRNP protein [Podila epigama]|nr:U3 snoRNP protein [Podila epigama]